MPVNKSARFRFEIIDECLRNDKRKWSKTDLLAYVNRRLELHFGEGTTISPSQLRYDLESMQSEYGAPIEMYQEGRKYLYRYDDPDFSIKTIPVENDDIIKLNTAIDILQQVKGFTIADEIAEIVSRLEHRHKFINHGQQTIISFDSASGVQGLEHLEDIYHAITRQNVLKITYQTFQSDVAKEWNIHPYFLKEYDNRWYLLGFCQEKEAIGIYALDRIKQLKISRLAYKSNELINNEDYFRDIVGVTKPAGETVTQVDLMFTAEIAPYIITKPIHNSQTIVERFEDGSLHVKLDIIINPELITVLLSFGKNVRVLSPDRLTLEILNSVWTLLDHYQ